MQTSAEINDRNSSPASYPERNPDHPQNLMVRSSNRDTPLVNVSCKSVLSRSDPNFNPDPFDPDHPQNRIDCSFCKYSMQIRLLFIK